MGTHEYSSSDVGRVAMKLALTSSRAEENTLRKEFSEAGFKTAAVDFGGVFITILPKLIEHTVVAAQRTGIVSDTHVGEGAVVGAVQSAVDQNIGGKIAIARKGDHLVVAIYGTVGVLHFNEVVAGIGHRAVYDNI